MAEDMQGDDRHALIAMARSDAQELGRWEAWADGANPVVLRDWVARFADDPDLLRSSPPAEVAALYRAAVAHRGWLDGLLLRRTHSALFAQLGASWDPEVVRGSRAYAVDEIRQAQHPELAGMRRGVLQALDDAFQDAAGTGVPVQSVLGALLHERGLVDGDPGLGEPVERVGARTLHAVGVERRQLAAPGLAVRRPGWVR